MHEIYYDWCGGLVEYRKILLEYRMCTGCFAPDTMKIGNDLGGRNT